MNKRFAIGCLTGILVFLVINLTSAHLSSDCGLSAVFGRDSCADDIARAGWPLLFYEKGGFDFRFMFNYPALIADLGLALLWAAGFGWVFSRSMK